MEIIEGIRQRIRKLTAETVKEEPIKTEVDSVDKFIEQVTEKGGKKIDIDRGQEEFIDKIGKTWLVCLTNYESRIGNEVIKFSEVNHEILKDEVTIGSDLEKRNVVTAVGRVRELRSRFPEGVEINFPFWQAVNFDGKEYERLVKERTGITPFDKEPKPLAAWKKEKGLISIQKSPAKERGKIL